MRIIGDANQSFKDFDTVAKLTDAILFTNFSLTIASALKEVAGITILVGALSGPELTIRFVKVLAVL